MPQAVTHFLIPVILLEIFRHFFIKNKKSFPIHYVFIGGLAGLLPDFDFAAYYVMSFFGFSMQEVHRTFSHNLFVPLFFLSLAGIFNKSKIKELWKHNLKLKNILLVLAFGVFMHLFLDAVIDGTLMPFYPLSNFEIGLNLVNIFPSAWRITIAPTIDAILLIGWMISLEIRGKISKFI